MFREKLIVTLPSKRAKKKKRKSRLYPFPSKLVVIVEIIQKELAFVRKRVYIPCNRDLGASIGNLERGDIEVKSKQLMSLVSTFCGGHVYSNLNAKKM